VTLGPKILQVFRLTLTPVQVLSAGTRAVTLGPKIL
jgi:hypothetical protein